MDTYKANILAVDDDKNLLDLLVDTLTAIGYRTVPAHGGVPALERLKDERFDLMITDIRMPDLDGIQLLKKVRRHYPDMPVLFITGFASPEMIGQATPDGFLAKPFRIAQIESLIESTLQRKPGDPTHGMRKVLVVDADDRFRTSLSEALNISHYTPFSARGAREALQELENGRFHAVIADVRLPDHNGFDLGRHVKERYPETPVILMGTAERPSQIGLEEAYDSYLRKPFNVGTVVELLDQIETTTPHGHR